jgi:TrmH family RNA methyltransferase
MAISKSTIKLINSLRLKKFRQKYNNFIVEGDKIVREAILESPQLIKALYALPEWLIQNAQDLPKDIKHEVNLGELKKISQLKTPNHVLAVLNRPTYSSGDVTLSNQLAIYLDGIQDPGNMGTILRIADWFGITYVFCAKNCVDVYHPKVIQATMGAFLRVKTIEKELSAIIEEWPELPILGAAMDGVNIFQLEPIDAGIIVIGNEGNGISALTQEMITRRISIPAAANSRAESLNAAVATGIICAVLSQNR